MRSIKTYLFVLFVMVALCADAQTLLRGPYLQNPTQSSIIVRWRTSDPAPSRVEYGTSVSNLNMVASDTTLRTNHAVKITGLQALSTYFYKVGDGSQFFNTAQNEYRFTTFPSTNSTGPTRIWALGDFGKGNSRQQAARIAFENFDDQQKANLWIWLGDNAYGDGTDQEYQDKVFDSVYGYQKIMHYLPFHAAPGNHDYNSFSPIINTQDPNAQTGTYLDIIDVPMAGENGGVASGTKLFYSYDYGDIHFVSFNTELASLVNPAHDWMGVNAAANFATSPMKLWLEQDLQANTKRWTIVYFHQPPHTGGSHNSASPIEVQMRAVREKWSPIFEQYGVDLVVAGHSHVYERTALINNFFGAWATFDSTKVVQGGLGSLASGNPYRKHFKGPNAKKGTVYVVSGNGGSSETSPPLNHPAMVADDGCDDCVGSVVFDIHRDTLTARYIKAYNGVADEFTIIKTDFPLDIKQVDVFKDATLSVYPNPTSSTITIESKLNENHYIYVQDVVGRKVWEKEIFGSMKETLNLKELGFNQGNYLVSMCKEDGNCKTMKITMK
jgi:predicted MPP superfamily phosphohydrolase